MGGGLAGRARHDRTHRLGVGVADTSRPSGRAVTDRPVCRGVGNTAFCYVSGSRRAPCKGAERNARTAPHRADSAVGWRCLPGVARHHRARAGLDGVAGGAAAREDRADHERHLHARPPAGLRRHGDEQLHPAHSPGGDHHSDPGGHARTGVARHRAVRSAVRHVGCDRPAGSRSGDGEGRQRQLDHLRPLAELGDRISREAQAGRAVPEGNACAGHRLRHDRDPEFAQRRCDDAALGSLPSVRRLLLQRSRADRHAVRHIHHHATVGRVRRLPHLPDHPAVGRQCGVGVLLRP